MAVSVVLVEITGHLDPGVVGEVIDFLVPALVVEIVVYLLGERPHHREGPKTGHPITREVLQGLVVCRESLPHRAGEEELGVGVDQPRLRYMLIIPVGQAETRDILRVHPTVRDIESRAYRLALVNRETLLRPAVDYVLEMRGGACGAGVRPGLVYLLGVHSPVGVAQIEKRSPVRIFHILLPGNGLDEAVTVDVQGTVIFRATEPASQPVQGFVRGAGRLPSPPTLSGRGETHYD